MKMFFSLFDPVFIIRVNVLEGARRLRFYPTIVCASKIQPTSHLLNFYFVLFWVFALLEN